MRQCNIAPGDIIEDVENPNFMEDAEFDELVRTIDEIGFLQPILAKELEDGTIQAVDGHHRLRAVKALEHDTVPVVVLEPGDPAYDKSPAVQIGMNKLRGELDLSNVATRLVDLTNAGWELDELTLSGFSASEIEELIATTNSDVDEEELLAGSSLADIEDDPAPRPFILEITFGSKEEYQACRKAIRRAAGKGNELADGLLHLCGVE